MWLCGTTPGLYAAPCVPWHRSECRPNPKTACATRPRASCPPTLPALKSPFACQCHVPRAFCPSLRPTAGPLLASCVQTPANTLSSLPFFTSPPSRMRMACLHPLPCNYLWAACSALSMPRLSHCLCPACPDILCHCLQPFHSCAPMYEQRPRTRPPL